MVAMDVDAASGRGAGPVLQAKLTCPYCGHLSVETMPVQACAFFHACEACGRVFKPKPGDCCVFCSYGDVPCPPVQRRRARDAAAQGLTRRR